MPHSPRRADLGQYRPPPPDPRRSRKKQKRKARPLLIFCVAAALLVCIICSTYNYVFSKLNVQPLTLSTDELSVEKAPRSGVTNIALLGIDSWEDTRGRSDAVLILSVDRKNNKLKLSSILRDSYLPIEGHGKDKLTHAYAYGGAALTIQTLNQNFSLDIKDYVALNFADLEHIIDAVGGIPMEISEKERKEINRIMKMNDADATELTHSGTLVLNGKEATAYSRIRKIDTDNKRASRQRDVIQALLSVCKSKSLLSYPKLLRDILSHVTTSLSPSEITSLALAALGTDLQLLQYSLPSAQDDAKGGVYDGMWVWRYDIQDAAKRLHNFIYES